MINEELKISPYVIPGLKYNPVVIIKYKTDEVLEFLYDYLNTNVADIKSYRRLGNIIYKRHLIFYVLYTLCKQTFTGIGKLFGRDHTSIMQAVYKVRDNVDYAKDLQFITSKMKAV